MVGGLQGIVNSISTGSDSGIRPEMAEAARFLSDPKVTIRIVHTTREMPPRVTNGFAAGRFGIEAKDPSGTTRRFIVQTEALVGHLSPVVPGKTRVDGYVAAVDDLYGEVASGQHLFPAEVEELLVSLLKAPAEGGRSALAQFVAAVHSNGDAQKLLAAYQKAGAEPPAHLKERKVTFVIPAGVPVQVVNVGELTAENLQKALANSPATGAKVEVSEQAVAGTPVSQKAVEVLRGAFKKSGEAFVYSQDQVDAAKRELLRFWGFPEKFVKEHGAEMRLNPVPGCDGALDADGRLTGSIGGTPFYGWIDRNDDWRKADVQAIVSEFETPKAATHLELSEHFFERNGVDSTQRAQITDRLFNALTSWGTIDETELAWAKNVLTTGYAIEGSITLQAFAEGKSAVDEQQSIRGVLTDGDGNRRGFTLALDSATLAHAPEGYSLKVTWHKQQGS